ncbi:serotriflin-like isoform X2 [Pleurodeles waltl]
MNLRTVMAVLLSAWMHDTYGMQPDLNTENEDVQKAILEKHNDLRRNVNPAPSDMLEMIWSPEAAENAATWAQPCFYGHSPEDKRTIPSSSCGENLFSAFFPMPWLDVIQHWYDEARFFTYGEGGQEGRVTGHFTQIVAANSVYLGCAVASCDGNFYYVCHYCPAGNIVGRIAVPYKAGNPCSECPNHCENGLCVNQCFYFNKAENCENVKDHCDTNLVKTMCEATCNC